MYFSGNLLTPQVHFRCVGNLVTLLKINTIYAVYLKSLTVVQAFLHDFKTLPKVVKKFCGETLLPFSPGSCSDCRRCRESLLRFVFCPPLSVLPSWQQGTLRQTHYLCLPGLSPTQISFLVLVCGLCSESRVGGMQCLCCRHWAWLCLARVTEQSACSHSSRCVHTETHKSDLNTHFALGAKTLKR